jgi:hypothetical protein
VRLANFFDRSLTAVAVLLAGTDPERLRARLSKLAVRVAFDRSAAGSSEGRASLELVTDLVARFYPGVLVEALDADAATVALRADLVRAARAIHPFVELRPRADGVVCTIVVGDTRPSGAGRCVFLGSEGWTASLHRSRPVGSVDSGNPFGAAVAACLAVADAFRLAFRDQLPAMREDEVIELDVLHATLGRSAAPVALPRDLDLADTHLVGLGAIGRATAWTLARAAGLRGRLHGVDHEPIELTNLQRYLAATQADVRKRRSKTRSVAKMFEGTDVEFVDHAITWGGYLAERGGCDVERVAVALDTAEGRVAVQASLPRRVLNAWTQPGDLGVSRHDFQTGPCLACLYLPDRKAPSHSENVAEALGLPEAEVREKLHLGFRVDRAFLERVEAATGVALDKLRPFEGEPLSNFYSKAVCGTYHFASPQRGDRGATAVPMAFQSALAGVLLAAEVVADVGLLRTRSMLPVTKMNVLRPLGRHLTEPAGKHRSGRCLCQDPTYVAAYGAKWATSPKRPPAAPASSSRGS